VKSPLKNIVFVICVFMLINACTLDRVRDSSFTSTSQSHNSNLVYLSPEPYWHNNFYPEPRWEYTYGLYSFPYGTAYENFRCDDIDRPYWHGRDHEHGRHHEHDGQPNHDNKGNHPHQQPSKPVKPSIPKNPQDHEQKPIITLPPVIKPLPAPGHPPVIHPSHVHELPSIPKPTHVPEHPREIDLPLELEKPPIIEHLQILDEKNIIVPHPVRGHHFIGEISPAIQPPHVHEGRHIPRPTNKVQEQHSIIELPQIREVPPALKSHPAHEKPLAIEPPSLNEEKVVVEPVHIHEEKTTIQPIPIHEHHSVVEPPMAHEKPPVIEPPSVHEEKVIIEPAPVHEHPLKILET
jgi:hypothetical protein